MKRKLPRGGEALKSYEGGNWVERETTARGKYLGVKSMKSSPER